MAGPAVEFEKILAPTVEQINADRITEVISNIFNI